MSPALLLLGVLTYFALLLVLARCVSHGSGAEGFYVGGRESPWPVVAFGMIGTSLSGVTFISVPGSVAANGFTYLQIVIGQLAGYAVIAFVLLPAYHRLRLASIYGLLGDRLGPAAQRLGSAFFILSRTLGATARLYLVVAVLHTLILQPLGLPFALGAAVVLVMILLYTVEGGVKALVWTDTLQTAGMLTGLFVCIALLWRPDALALLDAADLSRVWVGDPLSRDFSVKALLAGMFIAIAMTGLDQEMMQKSLSVAKLRDAQKNLLVLAVLMLVVVGAFLLLGGLLTLFAQAQGLAVKGDALFPTVVMQHLPAWVQIVFVLALVSALLPSADGALTALTASTCLDLLRVSREDTRTRRRVHYGFALLFLALVLGFKALDSTSMIYLILKLAGYTYGPLLGLFAFAIFTPRVVSGRALVAVCVVAPLLCAVLDFGQPWGGYQIGLELLLLNGALTWLGLTLVVSTKPVGTNTLEPNRASSVAAYLSLFNADRHVSLAVRHNLAAVLVSADLAEKHRAGLFPTPDWVNECRTRARHNLALLRSSILRTLARSSLICIAVAAAAMALGKVHPSLPVDYGKLISALGAFFACWGGLLQFHPPEASVKGTMLHETSHTLVVRALVLPGFALAAFGTVWWQ